MGLIFRYLREHWWLAAGALVLAAINQISSMAEPFIFRRIIDGYLIPSRHQSEREFALGAGLWLAAMVAATTIAWAAKTLQLSRVGQISQKVAATMFADGVRHAVFKPGVRFMDDLNPSQRPGKGRADPGAVLFQEFLRHPSLSDLEILPKRTQHLQNGRDIVHKRDVHGLDRGPERHTTVCYDDSVGMADAAEKGINVWIENSGF